jgi:hypothetical protein
VHSGTDLRPLFKAHPDLPFTRAIQGLRAAGVIKRIAPNTHILTAIALLVAAALPMKASAQQRSFYDGRGSFAGSSVTRGHSTSVYDRSGRFDGSIIRNSNGTNSYYDGRGRFTGSSTSARR